MLGYRFSPQQIGRHPGYLAGLGEITKRLARPEAHKNILAFVTAIRLASEGESDGAAKRGRHKGAIPHLELPRKTARAMRDNGLRDRPLAVAAALATANTFVQDIAERISQIVQKAVGGDAPLASPAAFTFHKYL